VGCLGVRGLYSKMHPTSKLSTGQDHSALLEPWVLLPRVPCWLLLEHARLLLAHETRLLWLHAHAESCWLALHHPTVIALIDQVSFPHQHTTTHQSSKAAARQRQVPVVHRISLDSHQ
jgi:hypothetical protein